MNEEIFEELTEQELLLGVIAAARRIRNPKTRWVKGVTRQERSTIMKAAGAAIAKAGSLIARDADGEDIAEQALALARSVLALATAMHAHDQVALDELARQVCDTIDQATSTPAEPEAEIPATPSIPKVGTMPLPPTVAPLAPSAPPKTIGPGGPWIGGSGMPARWPRPSGPIWGDRGGIFSSAADRTGTAYNASQVASLAMTAAHQLLPASAS